MVHEAKRPRLGRGGFVAAALAGANQLRQFPNVGMRGCVRQEAPLLYITNLQIQVRTENSPQALTHSLPLKPQQEREKKICVKLLKSPPTPAPLISGRVDGEGKGG